RLVANGRSQQQGIDCDENFSPVVKPSTICTVLSLAVLRDWPIHQLDVKNAFLHALLQRIIALLHSEFAMTDLGSLNYFFGISAQRSTSGLFLSQSKFAEEILERAHMQDCNPCRTPVDTESKLGSDGDPVCLYMHDPRDRHFTALKRILRYVRGTIEYGLQLHVSSTAQLTAYTDADWASCPVTRRSTSGYCVFLGDNLLFWFAKRQLTLSRSSAEAEYRGVANVVAETAWLRNLLL
ncbi:ribonuclease H-like domain-containing protein, partial [Tanacetum coccineum]